MTLTLKLYDRHARKLQRDTGLADGTTETLALVKIVFDSVEGHPKATLQITPLTGEAPAWSCWLECTSHRNSLQITPLTGEAPA